MGPLPKRAGVATRRAIVHGSKGEEWKKFVRKKFVNKKFIHKKFIHEKFIHEKFIHNKFIHEKISGCIIGLPGFV